MTAPSLERQHDAPIVLATGLRCLRCGTEHPFDTGAMLCPICGSAPGADPGVLDVQYDYTEVRRRMHGAGSERRDVFRFSAVLPVERPTGPSLGAGGTPLVSAPQLARRYGLSELWLKDETRNPTRCLKDRATAVAIAIAMKRGASTIYCASAGNAAISLAGFCAHAGLTARTYVPRGVAEERLAWLRAFGATIRIADGDYDVAYDEAERDAAVHGWYSRNCAFNPFLVEGKKTVAYEITEELGGTPDFVFAPVGDGCTLGAAGKGFREQRLMGMTDDVPRLIGVQSELMRPLVDRFEGRVRKTESSERTRPPLAASIAVGRPRNALRLLRELKESNGKMLDVSDAEIIEAQRALATGAGIVAEHTSAATLAALARLAEQESLEGKRGVLLITGGRVDAQSTDTSVPR
jgi:threonine synthase